MLPLAAADCTRAGGAAPQNASNALGAGLPQLKAVASTFYDNLVQLGKHSSEACFEFVSKGEAGPLIVSLMQEPAFTAHLQAQMVAVFEAITDGRKGARAYPQPREADFDAPAADLNKLGWSPGDLQLFTDERASPAPRRRKSANSCVIGSRPAGAQGPGHARCGCWQILKPIVAG
jgi:hypothetical protein